MNSPEQKIWWQCNGDLASSLTEIQYWMVTSALQRGDQKQALEYLRDFTRYTLQEYVRKFVPGEHYYALGEKFDDYDAARRHLIGKGYRCLGVKPVYPEGVEWD